MKRISFVLNVHPQVSSSSSVEYCSIFFLSGILKKFPKLQRGKKIIVEEHESNYNSDIMAEIENYQDSSDNIESANDKGESEDESSRDTQSGYEDEDPLSLSVCAKDMFGKAYDLL
ncbi:hypothetical protein EJD97_015118 [Solanum chilense]|uniref:Uncharacterized protein n=1 Tax=Solanum chilense TaxID=4083 RepID=A0A6N2BA03_SOLCI|nr:hypothetical protein EJD97_015118 [Solanum chilense]